MIDRPSWSAAWQGIGARSPGDDVHQRLVAAWSEKHRHYHTLQHLRECLELLDAVRSEAQRPAEVAVALWFHDAVYEPEREDNEARSAHWMRASTTDAGVDPAAIERLHAMVMATVDHMPVDEADAQLLVDIDLSIFGSEAARFDESNHQVRRECAHVPEPEWRIGRRRMLQKFLDRPRLFGTERFHGMFEARARENITRELNALKSAVPGA